MADEAATPVLDVLATMTEAAVEASELDPAAADSVAIRSSRRLGRGTRFLSLPLRRERRSGPELEDAQQDLVTLARWLDRAHRLGELQDREGTWSGSRGE